MTTLYDKLLNGYHHSPLVLVPVVFLVGLWLAMLVSYLVRVQRHRKQAVYLAVMTTVAGLSVLGVHGADWARRLFLFVTWVTTPLYLLTVVVVANDKGAPGHEAPDVRRLLDAYRNGEHLPLWFDRLYYLGLILWLVASGWIWSALAWWARGTVDLYCRQKALAPAAATTATEEGAKPS